jgi:hypothetical protein
MARVPHDPQEEPVRAPTVIVGTLVLVRLGLAGCATLGDVVREKGSVAKLPFEGKIRKWDLGKSMTWGPQLSCFR